MDKVLFIGSLNTKKNHFDGERIKTTLTFNALKDYFCVKPINLSRFKLLNVLRFVFLTVLFRKKYKYVIISKDRGGAKSLHKILRVLRFDMSKVIYFQIGPFLYDIVKNNDSIKKLFYDDKIITVETDSLKKQLNDIGFTNIYVLPNYKPIPDIDFVEQNYPKRILKLIYFSRIEKMKGIYQLIDVLEKVNKKTTIFTLDIFGIFMSKVDKDSIIKLSKKFNWITYKGTISLDSGLKYSELQGYDLHVFPTLYGEGFPGTIIDFFIAGVPTLSSRFARSSEILTNNDSIIFEQGNLVDFQKKLLYIYENQAILNKLRLNSFRRRNEFGIEIAKAFIEREILINE